MNKSTEDLFRWWECVHSGERGILVVRGFELPVLSGDI